MLCQNCRKNEANMHMKRIINGRAAEVHLCADCARSLGYSDAFAGFGLGLGDLLGDLLGASDTGALTGSAVRCPGCGKTFDEIAESGKIGCAECYNAFFDKLLPSLRRIHGKTDHAGKAPVGRRETPPADARTDAWKAELEEAVAAQDFERAALLRDRINAFSKGGDA